MEIALKNTIIAKTYSLTLKSFFKDEFKYGNDCYKIPFSHILYVKKQIFSYIQADCSFVCKKQQKCRGHQFIDFIELICDYQQYCVKYKKVYFKFFYFYNFKLTSNTTTTTMTLIPNKIKSWRMIPANMETICHLTYSQTLTIFKLKKKHLWQ